MAKNPGPRELRGGGRIIRRPVVHDDHFVGVLPGLQDDGPDRGPFVVRGDGGQDADLRLGIGNSLSRAAIVYERQIFPPWAERILFTL